MDLVQQYVAYRISEVRRSQKSIPLAYQSSMVLSPTSDGTFPRDAHLQILAHDHLHGYFLHVIRKHFQQDSYMGNQIAASVISHSPHQVKFDHSLPSRPVIPTITVQENTTIGSFAFCLCLRFSFSFPLGRQRGLVCRQIFL